MENLFSFFGDLKLFFSLFSPLKWIIFPVLTLIIFFLFKDTFLFYSQARFKNEIEWSLLEIRIPREIKKGAKAMEQFFAGLWSLINAPGGFKEKYLDGEVTLWHSFEIVGKGGKIYFYIRTPQKLKHIVESLLYAQYPDIEIVDAEDYTLEIPNSLDGLYKIGYDLGGSELKLGKPAPYPINTYVNFEEKLGDERIIDPISLIFEVLTKLRLEERVWIQILARPVFPQAWVKEGETIMKELKEKTMIKAKTPSSGGAQYPVLLTPGEEENMKSVNRKISKPGFEVLIRYIYIAPKDIFNSGLIRQISTYFGQYSSNLNYFMPNLNALTRVVWYRWPFFFPKRRLEARKRRILSRYKLRYLPEETFSARISDTSLFSFADLNKKSSISILNTEELATLYHLPTNVVITAPTMEKVESKKISPPGYIPF